MSDITHKIKVMQAYAGGAEIEFSDNVGVSWHRATSPRWDWANRDYRIKPQPKDIWVNEYSASHNAFNSRTDAVLDNKQRAYSAVRVATHYREVIDE